MESKKSHLIDQDLLSSNYSALEYADRYSTASSINSFLGENLMSVPIRTYNQQAMQDREGRDTFRGTEQVSVQRCRVCTIL